jgi:hypothetical protein
MGLPLTPGGVAPALTNKRCRAGQSARHQAVDVQTLADPRVGQVFQSLSVGSWNCVSEITA